MEWSRDVFTITDDRETVDSETVHRLLARTYWGHKRSRPVVEGLIQNSLCFSMLHDCEQIGFGRVVTDFTVFSWLSDMVIADDYQGKGLGVWFMECILSHPSIVNTQFVLQTQTAHEFYEKFDFERSDLLMWRFPSTT